MAEYVSPALLGVFLFFFFLRWGCAKIKRDSTAGHPPRHPMDSLEIGWWLR